MGEESQKKGLSRRKFIQGVGTGVIGSAVLPHVIKAQHETRAADEDTTGQLLDVKVNGKRYRVEIDPQTTLAEFLRDELNLTGTKIICNQGECGGCTVLLNDKAVYSCHMLALDANGKEVVTIEGLMNGEVIHPLQKAFLEKDGYQCGFCTPGQIMAAYALLKENPHPTKEEVMFNMSGNICRCGAYPKIVDSVLYAAEQQWSKKS
ncbi:2Fe-2S iron-sulfur cluster binding domain-containing protein [candidate division KSB1 bacterium]|nr:2Fe-2S iron-sulfur cluster binding domain-containing protein [candidate division KSB1 bacterium]